MWGIHMRSRVMHGVGYGDKGKEQEPRPASRAARPYDSISVRGGIV